MSFCWNLLERSLATLGPAARLAISLDQHKDSYRDRRETDEEERNFDPEWHEKPDRQVHRTHDLISAAVMHNKHDSVYACSPKCVSTRRAGADLPISEVPRELHERPGATLNLRVEGNRAACNRIRG